MAPDTPPDTAFARWLRRQMPKRGYPIDGPRAGGATRLAEDANIGQATMSRLLNGRQEPTVETLRKIGDLWGYSLPQMMIFAGLTTVEEIAKVQARSAPPIQVTGDTAPPESTVDPYRDPGDLPPYVDLTSLEPWEAQVLSALTELSPEERVETLRYVRAMRKRDQAADSLLPEEHRRSG